MKPAIAALLALSLAGCKDALTDTLKCGIAGISDVSVTGDVTASVNGCAAYGVSTGTGASTAITLTAGSLMEPTHTITLIRGGARPTLGNYTVGAPGSAQIDGTFLFDGGEAADRSFVFTAGTVNITKSTSGTLGGNINASATENTAAGTKTVAVSGSFTAKCVESGSTVC